MDLQITIPSYITGPFRTISLGTYRYTYGPSLGNSTALGNNLYYSYSMFTLFLTLGEDRLEMVNIFRQSALMCMYACIL